MRKNSLSHIKPIISVGAMAQALGHSRARFYQLMGTAYPYPIYDLRNRRPFYNAEMQEQCHDIRSNGIGWDGNYILSYSPRKQARVSDSKRSKTDPIITEMTETLQTMGLEVSPKQVQKAISHLYPDGFDNEDQGVVIRELFRHLKFK